MKAAPQLAYLKIRTPFNLPSWNDRMGGFPLNAVVSGLPQITSSLSDGQPVNAKSPSSSKIRLLARLRCNRLANGIGGLYLSPAQKRVKFAVSAPGLQHFTVTIISATHVLKT